MCVCVRACVCVCFQYIIKPQVATAVSQAIAADQIFEFRRPVRS